MTIVRIVLADPRTGQVPDGSAVNGQQLIVLADDTDHRAVPLWLPGFDFELLWWMLDRPARDAVMAGVLEETAARLLDAAGAAVTAVDIEPAGEDVPELRSGTAAARAELATAAGTRHVTVSAGYGLKLAVTAGAPVRVADEVMDRPASRSRARTCMRRSCCPRPSGRRAIPGSGRVSSRGTWRSPTAWTDGSWLAASLMPAGALAGLFLRRRRPVRDPGVRGPEPSGSAVLFQEIYADDYRGRVVTFRGQLRTAGVARQAGAAALG